MVGPYGAWPSSNLLAHRLTPRPTQVSLGLITSKGTTCFISLLDRSEPLCRFLDIAGVLVRVVDESLFAESFLRCCRYEGLLHITFSDDIARLDLVLICGFTDLQDGVIVLDSWSIAVLSLGLLRPHIG